MTERGILFVQANKINDNFTEIYNLLGGKHSADTNGISLH